MIRKKNAASVDLDVREQAQLLGLTRIVIGAGLFLFPRLSARLWVGDDAESPSALVAIRGLGARDIIIGAGILTAVDGDGPVREWLQASAAADVADTAAILMAGDVGVRHRLFTLVLTISGIAWGAKLLSELD